MTTFVLGAAAGGEVSNIRFWIASLVAISLLAGRIAKAFFDSLFESIGFGLGRLVFHAPRMLRMLAGLCGCAGVYYLLLDRPRWFVVSCVMLMAVDVFSSIGRTLQRQPRLLLMPYKGFATVGVTVWGWGTGWIPATVAFLVVRRVFRFLLEGMTISAAERLQRDRDRHTVELFKRLQSGKGFSGPRERIILYLRPFAITGRIKMDEAEFLDAVEGTAIQDERDPETKQWVSTSMPLLGVQVGVTEQASLLEQNGELEMCVEQGLRGAGHFIALGHPGEALGAGLLPSPEAEWQESVKLLIGAASLCVVVPSANAGTQWEINYIVGNGYLDKCCILMPPRVGKISYEAEWRAARAALADVLPLPEHQASGGMFRYGARPEAGPLPPLTQTPSSAPEALAIMVQALFPELPPWKVEGNPGSFRVGVHGGVSFYVGNSRRDATAER